MEMNGFLVTFENFSSYAHNQVHQHKKKKKKKKCPNGSSTKAKLITLTAANTIQSSDGQVLETKNQNIHRLVLTFYVIFFFKFAPHACSYKRCTRVRWELVTETLTGRLQYRFGRWYLEADRFFFFFSVRRCWELHSDLVFFYRQVVVAESFCGLGWF